ncbi:MAG: TadE/TadG family type IV pilus assembly protein [Geminicoccaceae bacterium]|nr:TadE/TadG family type IV pilus assembly protein [Geminicoccaceae bacterium]
MESPGGGAIKAGSALIRCTRGNIATEFGLILPLLLVMMFAAAELARFIIIHQKVDRVAVTMADLVARAETISESDLDDIFVSATEVARPFDLATLGIVIVSAVTNPDGDGPEVAWQRSGAGSYSATSKLGGEGEAATLPTGFLVNEGETAIISEVYFGFVPFLTDLVLGGQTIYRAAFHRPRLGTLDEVEAG